MISFGNRKPWWLFFALLLLQGGVPAKAQAAAAQPDTSHGPGAANRPAVAVGKPAWKWTVEERLTARFDPQSMAAREAERKARAEAIRKRQGGDLIVESRPLTETIVGRQTPELFLPTELFDTLLGEGFPVADRQAARDWIQSKAAALGFGRDFWERLEEAASPYLNLRNEQDARGQITSVSEGEDLRLCRERAQALQAAEREFGEESFLRLLYEVVAPDLQVGRMLGPGPPDYQLYEEKLLFQEGGCQ